MIGRIAASRLRSVTLISGAFGVFRRTAVVAAGGYTGDTVGEDLELVVKLHRHMLDRGQDYRILFLPDPVCRTQVPEHWRDLARQRMRWQRGALETLARHRDMAFRPRYGRFAFLGIGQIVLIDFLGPIAEAFGYLLLTPFWALGALDTEIMLAFIAVTALFGVFISIGAVLLDDIYVRRSPRKRHLLWLLVASLLENFGYRQLNGLWRIAAFVQFAKGDKAWGPIRRRTFSAD